MGFLGAISNFLNGPVDNNLTNHPQDIRNTKRGLNRLGYFGDDTENDFITRELDTGIKSFQKDNDLRVDGKLLPGGDQSEKNERGTLPTVNREEIMRQLAEHRQNEYQQKEEAIRFLQEKQNENAGSAVGGFGQPAQNVDATGRMIRDESTPVPKRKPTLSESKKDNVFDQFRENL